MNETEGPREPKFRGSCLPDLDPLPGGPGRATTPETFNSLMTDLEDKIFGRLSDATWVYPGHEADTTLTAERPTWKNDASAAGKRSPRSRRDCSRRYLSRGGPTSTGLRPGLTLVLPSLGV